MYEPYKLEHKMVHRVIFGLYFWSIVVNYNHRVYINRPFICVLAMTEASLFKGCEFNGHLRTLNG